MNIIAFIILVLAALAAFLSWYEATPRRFASLNLSVFLFIVGVISIYVFAVEPIVKFD